ncbi:hypothetical protein BWD121_009560 [Bartonella sp. WD12.1]|nr:hypothetical protein BWD121_009560 [Bartonella sp. WD12.1]
MLYQQKITAKYLSSNVEHSLSCLKESSILNVITKDEHNTKENTIKIIIQKFNKDNQHISMLQLLLYTNSLISYLSKFYLRSTAVYILSNTPVFNTLDLNVLFDNTLLPLLSKNTLSQLYKVYQQQRRKYCFPIFIKKAWKKHFMDYFPRLLTYKVSLALKFFNILPATTAHRNL